MHIYKFVPFLKLPHGVPKHKYTIMYLTILLLLAFKWSPIMLPMWKERREKAGMRKQTKKNISLHHYII